MSSKLSEVAFTFEGKERQIYEEEKRCIVIAKVQKHLKRQRRMVVLGNCTISDHI